MFTIDHMREAWAHALAEITAAIAYLDAEKRGVGSSPRSAADRWLATLRRDQAEYRALLTDHPASTC